MDVRRVIGPIESPQVLTEQTVPNTKQIISEPVHRNGMQYHPAVVRILEPSVIKPRHKDYFSEDGSVSTILSEIDYLWKNEELFSHKDDPYSNFYTSYLLQLTEVVEKKRKHFSNLEKIINIDGISRFEREYIKLANRGDLSDLQKAIHLTQAVELVLLGVNITPVLKNINYVPDKAHKPGEEHVAKQNGEHTRGFRQELQAGWFLAKFVYGFNALNPAPNDYSHSIILSGLKRSKISHKRSKEIDDGTRSTFKVRKHKKGKDIEAFTREIDVLTPNSIVSVKSNKKSYSEQIKDLFYIILDDKTLSLKEKVDQIILIKCSETPEQFMPNYSSRPRYQELKETIVRESVDLIREYASLDQEGESLLRKLGSKHSIEIYFTPSVKNFDEMQKWIGSYYASAENKARITA